MIIILTPLVCTLICQGVSHSEFSDIAERVYIKVAHSDEKEFARFQRAVIYQNVPSQNIEEFKQYSNEKSQSLLVEYSEWLNTKIDENETESQ